MKIRLLKIFVFGSLFCNINGHNYMRTEYENTRSDVDISVKIHCQIFLAYMRTEAARR